MRSLSIVRVNTEMSNLEDDETSRWDALASLPSVRRFGVSEVGSGGWETALHFARTPVDVVLDAALVGSVAASSLVDRHDKDGTAPAVVEKLCIIVLFVLVSHSLVSGRWLWLVMS